MPALDAHGLDVGTGGFGDPQPVQGQQGDQRVLSGRPEARGDEQAAELVAVQRRGVRLTVQPRPTDVHGGRVVQKFFLDGVAVEPGDGAQPPCDGGPCPAAGFQVPGEALDVRAAGAEQGQAAGVAQLAYRRRSTSHARMLTPSSRGVTPG